MSTIAALIPSDPEHHDLLMGLLMDDEVQGIEERADALVFFFEEAHIDSIRRVFEEQAAPFALGPVTYEVIHDRNWNEEWEKTIKPIQVGRFWIRPSWDEQSVPEGHMELIIDPKMSFGTGYHETTRLMMGALPEMVNEGDTVLDAGTGTGVLAFAALKLDAGSALAFDFDPICKENAEENAAMNDLAERFEMLVGTERVVPEGRQFNVIMANINREALRAMIPALTGFMAEGAKIGLAGLLISDREIMLKTLESNRLEAIREATEGDWWSVWAQKSIS